MKKENRQEKQAKVNIIKQLLKRIYVHLDKTRFSLKVIYTLIDVLDELNFSDRYLHMDIERAIGAHLARLTSS
jgi:hypothetical protein